MGTLVALGGLTAGIIALAAQLWPTVATLVVIRVALRGVRWPR